MVNSVVVHSYPSLRHVTTLHVSDKALTGSVLNTVGTKIILAIPEDNKLKVWDAWGKNKEIKRQSSFMDSTIR
jgi:cell division cycle protein 20 (cofactor of APC complex)